MMAPATAAATDSVHEVTARAVWRPTATLEAALVLGLVIAVVGLLASRVDVVLLALPLLVSAALAVDRRPMDGSESTSRVEVTTSSTTSGTPGYDYVFTLTVPPQVEYVQLRLVVCGAPAMTVLLAPRDACRVTGHAMVWRSGRHRVLAGTYRLVGMDGAWRTLPASTAVVERVVAPTIVPVDVLPLPHRLTGLTGTHESVRPGDGGEFRDVHPYAPGDRLRRIDWKATARRAQSVGSLYVRRTSATSDATITLVIDSSDDLGARVATWPLASSMHERTSLDLAREAAASLAVAAIRMGDRVGLLDLAAHDGVVAAGGGQRHLDRLLRRLSVSEPVGTRLTRRRAPVVPAGSMVYVFTSLLDDEPAAIAQLWRAAGHRVVAVDVLPAPQLEGAEQTTRLAHRLLMAERRRRVQRLRATGVELLRWSDDSATSWREAGAEAVVLGGVAPGALASGAVASRAVALRALARAGRRR